MKSSELNQIEMRAADWIAERDRREGRLTLERQLELDQWLDASTAHRIAFLRLERTWRRADRLRALQPATATLESEPPRRTRWDWLARPAYRAAAGLSAAALTLVLALLVDRGAGPNPLNYATARGQRETVMLADGSHLTLNTATRLRTAVTAQSRQVWLEQGEAFFDIAHDPKRPFVIHAGHQTVTVLGTKFSLFRDGDQLRVAVLEGRVQVVQNEPDEQSRPTVLTRDEAALADVRNVLVTQESRQQLTASLSWMQGKLVFSDVSLAEAARQFNRYSNKQLVVKDEAAARIGIGGIFDAGNVEAFARLLHAGFGLEVQIKGDQIEVSSPAS